MRTLTLRSAFVILLVLHAIAIAIGVGGAMYEQRVSATEVTGTHQNLLSGVSALNSQVTVGTAFMPRCRESAVYISWGAGTSSGAVTVETANDAAYTGTWAPLATVAWVAASKQDVVQITGVHLAIRTRISTVIGGGTVSSFIVCN